MRIRACLLFFPDYDNKFLAIDIDLSMKYKFGIRLEHKT